METENRIEPEERALPAGLTRGGMLQQLMDHISDNIYFMDAQGRIVLINRAGAKWLGFDSPEELIGKTDYDLFTEEHAAPAFADEQRIIATGEPVIGIEEKETWADGHVTWVSTTKMPLRDDHGNIVGIFGISRNITEQKERELTIERLNHQMESELKLAGEVQRSFLAPPHLQFRVSGARAGRSLHVVHENRPSGHVGGDFFCLMPLSTTKAGIFVADVMGHGVGAALTMSALNAMVRYDSGDSDGPADFLMRLNRHLREAISREDGMQFITAFYLELETEDGSIRFSSAGHHTPILIRSGSGEAIRLCAQEEIRGPALMLMPEASFKMVEGKLLPGDRLLLFTDGLTEMPATPDGDDLGMDGLLELVGTMPANELAAFVPEVIAAVLAAGGQEAFRDDVCLIGVDYK